MTVVAKFGGSSMADAESICQVAEILRGDPRQTVAVVSAPGVCTKYPIKVTDQLFQNEVDAVGYRFLEIMTELGLSTNKLPGMLAWVKLAHVKSRVAFGEYMSAYILANFLGWKFVDARRVFVLNQRGEVVTVSPVWKSGEKVVVPGFYGSGLSGGVELFPRGGSDISGALIAASVGARLYINWTDVAGVYSSDPKSNSRAEHLPFLTYQEARTMFEQGATVFHPEAVSPVERARIPVHVRNTFSPESLSTLIWA